MYYILGGQHFLRALKELRKDYLKAGTPPAALPKSLQYCEMEVMFSSTKPEVRAKASGDHQRAQRGEAPGISDFFAICLDEAVSLMRTRGSAFFSDDKVYQMFEHSGMQMDVSDAKKEKNKSGVTQQNAAELQVWH